MAKLASECEELPAYLYVTCIASACLSLMYKTGRPVFVVRKRCFCPCMEVTRDNAVDHVIVFTSAGRGDGTWNGEGIHRESFTGSLTRAVQVGWPCDYVRR